VIAIVALSVRRWNPDPSEVYVERKTMEQNAFRVSRFLVFEPIWARRRDPWFVPGRQRFMQIAAGDRGYTWAGRRNPCMGRDARAAAMGKEEAPKGHKRPKNPLKWGGRAAADIFRPPGRREGGGGGGVGGGAGPSLDPDEGRKATQMFDLMEESSPGGRSSTKGGTPPGLCAGSLPDRITIEDGTTAFGVRGGEPLAVK